MKDLRCSGQVVAKELTGNPLLEIAGIRDATFYCMLPPDHEGPHLTRRPDGQPLWLPR